MKLEFLRNEALKFGVELSEEMILKLERYADILLERNTVVNLTAITDEYEVAVKHFLDSLTLLSCGKIRSGMRVADIGAGAGFPSIPCAVAREDVSFVLLDSLNKRVSFLEEARRELGLENVTAVHLRAEDAGRNKEYREMFDAATARAVAELSTLSEYALPFVKTGGYFLAMKGGAPGEEIENAKKAVEILGGKIEEVREVKIKPLDIRHTIVVVKKIASTPAGYPRKAGTPSKNPIR